jgi:hypothetical protein
MGLGAVLLTGYLFGITRANFLDTYSHFLFDCAALGFYLSYFTKHWPRPKTSSEAGALNWTGILMGWAAVMFLVPMQHPIIQLVGLRGNAFLLPFLIVGSRLSDREGRDLGVVLALLNLIALGFAGAEYFIGVPAFFPANPVTEIIYRSQDIAGATAFRIPASFSSAASYAGTMVASMPWLVGVWIQRQELGVRRVLLAAGMGAAMIGVFLTGTRMASVQLFLLLVVISLSGRMSVALWVGWILMLVGVGFLVSSEERMQRFFTLQNTDEVVVRIEGSVNMNFLDLLTNYPLGNGLGGGGTSIPYFLQDLITNPVMMESEYSRILLEQGVVGLALWITFVTWIFTRPAPATQHPWALGRRLLWVFALSAFAAGLIGIGLMTAIPQTTLLFLGMGFLLGSRPVPAGNRPAVDAASQHEPATAAA